MTVALSLNGVRGTYVSPICTMTRATKIASRCSEREDTCPRQKMVQRLFFQLDQHKSRCSDHTWSTPSDHSRAAAQNKIRAAPHSVCKPRTKPALDAPVWQHRPPAAGIIRLRQLCDHLCNIAQEIRSSTPPAR